MKGFRRGVRLREVLPLLVFLAAASGDALAQVVLETRSPGVACEKLPTVASAQFVEITSTFVPAHHQVPGHCRVVGTIRTDLHFEIFLPDSWNSRFCMLGNGGYAGHFPKAPGKRDRALTLGFAVAWTDTGHNSSEQPLASFAVDRQKLLDFAYEAVRVTAAASTRLIGLYYGRPPRWSYFDGCSTGGRQGLILAQRFPEQFDGIIVGAPILDETGQRISQVWMANALAKAPLRPDQLTLLAETIYALCDGADGLEDGLIQDPRRCDFQVSRDLPICGEAGVEGQHCFSQRQVAALSRIYADVTGAGQRLYPGLPVGAEISVPGWKSGWEDWLVAEKGRPTTAVLFAQSFFRYMGFRESDPGFELKDFDFDQDPFRLDWIKPILNATSTDLARFKTRGGKILMYAGWADAAVNPLSAVEYYEGVMEMMGDSTQDFFRLFMVPGMFHCVGGVGPWFFDKLEPMMRWVEQGKAPDALTANQTPTGGRSRPLCPYPQVALYTGSGSPLQASQFTCQAPAP